MLVQLSVNIDTVLLQDLLAYLEEVRSELEPSEATAYAVQYWLAAMRQSAAPSPERAGRGYQWKSLFLPEGTRLRMYCQHEYGYAQVVGDQIIYQGRALTPNQLVTACSGGTRNAWRDLSLKFPGEKTWKLACVHRNAWERLRKQEAAEVAAAATPGTSAGQESMWMGGERRRATTALDDVAFD